MTQQEIERATLQHLVLEAVISPTGRQLIINITIVYRLLVKSCWFDLYKRGSAGQMVAETGFNASTDVISEPHMGQMKNLDREKASATQ